MSEEIEKYYQMQGKEITDEFFDAKIFNEKLTRDDIDHVENVLAFYLQSNAQSVKKVTELTVKMKMRQE